MVLLAEAQVSLLLISIGPGRQSVEIRWPPSLRETPKIAGHSSPYRRPIDRGMRRHRITWPVEITPTGLQDSPATV
jgi:hypothetical protein